jgi:hypothetical protein
VSARGGGVTKISERLDEAFWGTVPFFAGRARRPAVHADCRELVFEREDRIL